MGTCEKENCLNMAVNKYRFCGKHLGFGQDNNEGKMCKHHKNKYACKGYDRCGFCLGFGVSCFE